MAIEKLPDVEWVMAWKSKYGKTDREDEVIFEREHALAHLLVNDVVFLNEYHWRDDWPEDARKVIAVCVNCNDVFAWGCADAEDLNYDQIETLYRMWSKDNEWGAAVWCMLQRKQMPQKPVEDRIRKAGIWDLDKLGLGANTMEAEVTAYLGSMIASGIIKPAA